MKNIIKIITLIAVTVSLSTNAQTYEWAKGVGSTGHDEAENIIVDANGNSYTIGSFTNTVDFDPGNGAQNRTSNGSYDMFVLKLDPNGNFLWVNQIGGTMDEQAFGIVINSNDELLISGYFQGTVDFDSGIGVQNLSTQGGEDMFLLKLNQQGDFVWVKHFTGTTQSTTDCYDLVLDNNDNIYLTGRFNDATDFNPGAGSQLLYSLAGGFSVFVLKLDSNGEFVWVKQMDGTSNTFGISIDVDNNGSVYTTGEFKGTIDFDPGVGIVNKISQGNTDQFIQKLDASGVYVWCYTFGNTGYDIAFDLTIDNNNSVYVTGSLDYISSMGSPINNIDFNLDGFGSAIIGQGNYTIKIKTSGIVDWAKFHEGANRSGGITYRNGYVYSTAGLSTGPNLDMNPNAGVDLFNSAGSFDAYVQKLDTNGNYIWTVMYGGTNDEFTNSIYVTNSNDIYTTGRFMSVSDMDFGVPTDYIISTGQADIFVHKISQCSTVYGTDIQIACTSYQWIDGTTYSMSNSTATHTIVGGASNGCDSIVTLDLTILPNSASTYNDTICDDIPYQFGTQTLNYGGQFIETFQNTNGCDSVVTLNLVIELLPLANITMVGNDLQANIGGDSYQWYYNGIAINGETNQIHTPLQNGDYTVVVVSQRGCVKMSDPFTVEGLGIDNYSFNFSVAPNPSNGMFTLKSDIKYTYTVFNLIGEIIIESTQKTNSSTIDLSNFNSGIYFLKINTYNGQTKSIKLIKK